MIQICLRCALRKLQVLLHDIEQALPRGLIQILKVDIDSNPLPCDYSADQSPAFHSIIICWEPVTVEACDFDDVTRHLGLCSWLPTLGGATCTYLCRHFELKIQHL